MSTISEPSGNRKASREMVINHYCRVLDCANETVLRQFAQSLIEVIDNKR